MSNSVSEEETETLNKIIIKGGKDGLLISIPDGNWVELLQQLSEILEKDKNFWIGASASVDLGNHALDEIQLNRFYEMLIKRHHLIISAIYSKDEATRSFAEKLKLKVGKVHPLMQTQAPNIIQDAPIVSGVSNSSSNTSNATYIKQTLRSGQTVRFDGNVIVYGDTNPGSEIIASGDIIVIGTLRGIAHAGAKGNENCQVVATNLKATQIRIGSVIGMSSDEKNQSLPVPEVASVVDGKIYISPLKVKRTG